MFSHRDVASAASFNDAGGTGDCLRSRLAMPQSLLHGLLPIDA